MNEILNTEILNDETLGISNFTILKIILIIVFTSVYITYIFSKSFTDFTIKHEISKSSKLFFVKRSVLFAGLLIIYGIFLVTDFEYVFLKISNFNVSVQSIIQVLLLLQLGSLMNWLVNNIYVKSHFAHREATNIPVNSNDIIPENGTNLIKWVFYTYSAIFILRNFSKPFVLIQREIKGEIFNISLSDVLSSVFVILVAGLISWFLTNIYLHRIYTKKGIDIGAQYAVNQLLRYIIYVIAILMALNNLVSEMNIVYGGAAALLVGVGLGLQNTFNDFFSGIILLFERSVKVGNILEIDGEVGRVMSIGLRASRIETRNSVSMLVPNSKLINQSVINWTHFDDIVRFSIDIGVAYGTDTALVKNLLLEAIKSSDLIISYPSPFVRFNDFGDSSLLFTLYFFTNHVMTVENIKSDIRFKVDELFKSNKISMPFPQRDLWIRNPETLLPKAP